MLSRWLRPAIRLAHARLRGRLMHMRASNLLLALLISCGEPTRSNSDAGLLDGASTPGSWTACSSPSGYAICGGPAKCPTPICSPRSACFCIDGPAEPPMEASYVWNPPLAQFYRTAFGWAFNTQETPCGDGNLMIAASSVIAPTRFDCMPLEMGELFDDAGARARVRYADLSMWDGTPVPPRLDSCPVSSSTMRFCGAGCGTCQVDETCVGLSPKHPAGFCFPKAMPPAITAVDLCNASMTGPPQACGAGKVCFTFIVEPGAQPVADQYGYCASPLDCSDVATKLGGKCSP